MQCIRNAYVTREYEPKLCHMLGTKPNQFRESELLTKTTHIYFTGEKNKRKADKKNAAIFFRKLDSIQVFDLHSMGLFMTKEVQLNSSIAADPYICAWAEAIRLPSTM